MIRYSSKNNEKSRKKEKAAGLYVHIPFCLHKCPYCDFYSGDDLAGVDSLVEGIIKEMSFFQGRFGLFDTLYLGGGTPSLLEPRQVGRILEAARDRFDISSDAEITLEANPGTVTHEKLEAFRCIGINRLTLGVQSFSDKTLAALGRIHNGAQALAAVDMARKAGFGNLAVDIMFAVPGQSLSSLMTDLETAVCLGPEHISCYSLTFEPGTTMARKAASGKIRPLPEERGAKMFLQARKFLSGAGYPAYEVSNFARSPKHQSRHNRKYWDFSPYLGLGPSAHSYLENRRWWNPPDLDLYLKKIRANEAPTEAAEELTRAQQICEAVMLGLRTDRGIDDMEFKNHFGFYFSNALKPTLKELAALGYLAYGRGRTALTNNGFLLLDSIVERLVERFRDGQEYY